MAKKMTLLRKWGSLSSLEKELRVQKLTATQRKIDKSWSDSELSCSVDNPRSVVVAARKPSIAPRFPAAIGEKGVAWASSSDSSDLPPLGCRQICTVVILALASFFTTVMDLSMAPFFPLEAKKLDASSAEVAVIFGIFELTVLILAPLCAKHVITMGSKNMFVSSILLEGTATVLFGLTTNLPKGLPFVAGCCLARIFQGVGDAGFFTSSMTIIANEFPDRVGTLVALMETFIGLGAIIGPPLSAALYQFGGYVVPFLFTGILLIVAGIAGIMFVSCHEDGSPQKTGSIWEILQIPAMVLMCVAVTTGVACINFLDPTLQLHLLEFNLPPFFVGLMFMAVHGVYATAAPLWRLVTDRFWLNWEVMMSGVFFAMLAMIFIGPAPFIPAEKSIVSVGFSEVLLGMGASAVYVPAFENGLEILRRYNYPDSFATYSLVTGLFQSSFSLGGFLGPTVGGVLAGQIGFCWTATIFSGINLIVFGLLIYYFIYSHYKKKPERSQSDDLMRIMSDCALATSDLGKPPSGGDLYSYDE